MREFHTDHRDVYALGSGSYLTGPRPNGQGRREHSSTRSGHIGAGRERHRTALTEALIVLLFVFASAQILGSIAVAVQLAVLVALLVLHRRDIPVMVWRALPILAVGLWATASAFWSTDPSVSGRYGSQFLATLVIGVVVAGVISAARLPLLLFVGTSVVLVLSILSGNLGQSEAGPVLIGLTGSKNAFAYLCLLNIMCAIPVMIGVGQASKLLRLTATGMLPVALWYIANGQAASAQVQCILGLALFGGLIWATHVRQGTRLFVLACMLIGGIGLVSALPELKALSSRFTTDVLKKDSTLTGRTYLWAKADYLIEQRPGIGWGFRSTWLGSTPETIGLLRWAHLTDGRGFNFHNTARELRVDIGIVGLILFFAPILLALGRFAVVMFLRPSIISAFALIILVLIAVVRAQTETIIGAFGTDMILLAALAYFGLGYAPLHERPTTQLAQSRRVSNGKDAGRPRLRSWS